MGSEVVTRLRVAQPDASNPTHLHLISRLENDQIGWLATTRQDGRPQAVPILFVYVEGLVVLFSAAWSAKTRHLRSRPACSFFLQTADGGDDCVLVDGSAAILADDDPLVVVAETALARKYDLGARLETWRQEFSVPIGIVPSRIVAWTKPEGQLQYVRIDSPA